MPEVPQTGDAVLELVRRAEIADDDVLANFLTRSGPIPPTASDTATRLVQAGILTPFQARLILQGKHRGFKLGPYRILNQIGAGGMGTVFLADHTALKRQVALKVLPAKHALDPLNVERFYREARAAAALDHPNVVHAYDVMCDKGTHFLVLEYIDGDTLDRKLAAAGRLPVGQAVSYAVQAAAGLQHAHEKGVAHRDIKPSNLLVGRDGLVKILDLGLAQFFEDSSTKLGGGSSSGRVSGQVMGTTDYVAPEQLLDTVAVDHRADIYNLGATLYHLLTGRPPFTGTTTAVMLAHQMSAVTPPHKLCDEVPESLSAVVEKMLAKNPDDRYPTAAEVVQALLPFVDAPDSKGRASGKLPPLAAAAVAESTASLNLKPAIQAALAATAARRKKRLVLAGVAGGVLLVAIALGVYFARKDNSPAKKTEPPEVPNGVQPHLNPPKPVGPPEVLTLAFKPDIGPKTAGEAVVFTPDGQFLLISGNDKLVRVFNAADGQLVRKLEGHTGNVRTMALVPGDAPRALTAGTDKTIKLWDYATGTTIRTYDGQNAYVTEVVPLPDGKRFLASADNGTIWMWDIESGDVLKRYEPAKLPVYALAVSRDGKRAVAGTWDGKRNAAKPGEDLSNFAPVHVWWFEVESGNEGGRRPVTASVAHVNFSPDSKKVAFGNADGVTTWELDTLRLGTLAGATKRVTCATFSKDGRHVLSTGYDNSLHIWEAATGKPVTVEPGMPGQGFNIAISPDGTRAAVVGGNGSAFVWQLPAVVVGK